jgi:hypothetical protein
MIHPQVMVGEDSLRKIKVWVPLEVHFILIGQKIMNLKFL